MPRHAISAYNVFFCIYLFFRFLFCQSRKCLHVAKISVQIDCAEGLGRVIHAILVSAAVHGSCIWYLGSRGSLGLKCAVREREE